MARVHVPIRLRWSDLDAYGHVNNAEMLRLLEEARIRVFWTGEIGGVNGGADAAGAPADGDRPEFAGSGILNAQHGSETLTLIARQEIEYLAPVPYLGSPLDIQLWIGRLGGASLDVCYEVWSPVGTESAVLYARAATTVVLMDAASGRTRRLTDDERAACDRLVAAPIEFAKRR